MSTFLIYYPSIEIQNKISKIYKEAHMNTYLIIYKTRVAKKSWISLSIYDISRTYYRKGKQTIWKNSQKIDINTRKKLWKI
jgi:hypothetical protein